MPRIAIRRSSVAKYQHCLANEIVYPCQRNARRALVTSTKRFYAFDITKERLIASGPRHRNLMLVRPLCCRLVLLSEELVIFYAWPVRRVFPEDRNRDAQLANIRYSELRCIVKKFARAHPLKNARNPARHDMSHKKRQSLCHIWLCPTDTSLLFSFSPLFLYWDTCLR